jgi:hypothetical protein
MGRGACTLALCDDIARASFALPALRGDAELGLDFVKAQTGPGVAGDFAVRDASAYTDDHGNTGRVAVDGVDAF